MTTTYDTDPTKRVMIAAGLASGVAAGALLGVVLFYGNSSQPTEVTSAPAPQPAVVVGSGTAGR